MEKWIGVEFQSASGPTPQFKEFCRDLKKYLPEVSLRIGHFEVSGFYNNKDKWAYFNMSDVRFFKNEWYNDVMFRTAKDSNDFHGGSNQYCTLPNLMHNLKRITE